MANTQNNIVATIILENSEFKKSLYEVQNVMDSFAKNSSKLFNDINTSFSKSTNEVKHFNNALKKVSNEAIQSSQRYEGLSTSLKNTTGSILRTNSGIRETSKALSSSSKATSKTGKAMSFLNGVMKKSTSALEKLKNKTVTTASQYAGLGDAALRVGATLTGLNIGFSTIRAGIERFDIIQTFPRAMSAFGVATEESAVQIKKLKEGILGLPPSLSDVVSDTKRVYQALGNLDKSTSTVLALQSAFAGAKSKTDEQARAMDLYTRALTKGKVDIHAYTDLQQAMGKGFLIVAEKLGYSKDRMDYFQEAVTKGRISANKFNDALIESQGELQNLAKTASGGIMINLANINNRLNSVAETGIIKFSSALKEVTGEDLEGNLQKLAQGISNFGKTLSENQDIVDFFKIVIIKIKDTFGELHNNFNKFMELFKTEFGQNLLKVLGDATPHILGTQISLLLLGTAIKIMMLPILIVVGYLKKLIGFLQLISLGIPIVYKTLILLKNGFLGLFAGIKFIISGFKQLFIVFATNPFLLIIAAVVALVVIIVLNWTHIQNFLMNVWRSISDAVGPILGPIATIIGTIWNVIKFFTQDIWSQIGGFFGGIWDKIIGKTNESTTQVKDTVNTSWTGIKDTTNQSWGDISGILSGKLGDMNNITQLKSTDITASIGKEWDSIEKLTGTSWGETESVLLKNLGSMETNASEKTKDVQRHLSENWNSANSDTLSYWGTVSNYLVDTWSSLDSYSSYYFSQIVATIRSAWVNISNLMGSIRKEMSTSIPGPLSLFIGGNYGPIAVSSVGVEDTLNESYRNLISSNFSINKSSSLYDFKNFKSDLNSFNFDKLEHKANIEVNVYLDSDELITKTKKNMDTALGYQVKLQKRRGLI